MYLRLPYIAFHGTLYTSTPAIRQLYIGIFIIQVFLCVVWHRDVKKYIGDLVNSAIQNTRLILHHHLFIIAGTRPRKTIRSCFVCWSSFCLLSAVKKPRAIMVFNVQHISIHTSAFYRQYFYWKIIRLVSLRWWSFAQSQWNIQSSFIVSFFFFQGYLAQRHFLLFLNEIFSIRNI